ncbi:YfjI family protein [Ottowia beijingensis]|uniref:YfjI family protein n=1 Tax=Ottowia beijingensis TaxID=1207057 RepID=UPI00364462B0
MQPSFRYQVKPDRYPDTLGRAVDDVVKATGAPRPLVECAALGALAVAGQSIARVQRPGLPGTPLGLFIFVVAESGERKSTVDAIFRRDLQELEARWMAEHDGAQHQNAAQVIAWNEQVKGLKAEIRRAAVRRPESIQELQRQLERVLAGRPVKPAQPRLFYDDISPRALLEGMQQWPAGGVFSPEGARHLTGQTMRDLETLCLLWGGEMARVERSRTTLIETIDTSLTISVMVQSKAFKQFCQSKDEMARSSGFLSRCLVINPESTQGTRTSGVALGNRDGLDNFLARLRELAEESRATIKGERSRRKLFFSESAQDELDSYVNKSESGSLVDAKYGAIRDWVSKSGEHVTRLAGLFHLLESSGDEIGEDILKKAIAWVEDFKGEHLRLFGSFGVFVEDYEDANTLSKWLRKKRDNYPARATWTVRELRQYGPVFMRAKSNGRLERALENLRENNIISFHSLSNGVELCYLRRDWDFIRLDPQVVKEISDREANINRRKPQAKAHTGAFGLMDSSKYDLL